MKKSHFFLPLAVLLFPTVTGRAHCGADAGHRVQGKSHPVDSGG